MLTEKDGILKSSFALGLTKKSQKANFTLLTEPVERIFWGNTDFLVSPVSHLVSLNRNGIEVMLYMTLIVAMLILIYKRANHIGYKTAKRRFTMEMRNIVISMIVIECGGDPAIFFKT